MITIQAGQGYNRDNVDKRYSELYPMSHSSPQMKLEYNFNEINSFRWFFPQDQHIGWQYIADVYLLLTKVQLQIMQNYSYKNTTALQLIQTKRFSWH